MSEISHGEKVELKQALDILIRNKTDAVGVVLYLYLKFKMKNADIQNAFKEFKKKADSPDRDRGRIISPYGN